MQRFIVIECTERRRVANVFYWYKVLKSKSNEVLNNDRDHRQEISILLTGFVELSIYQCTNSIEGGLCIRAFGNQGDGFTHTRLKH